MIKVSNIKKSVKDADDTDNESNMLHLKFRIRSIIDSASMFFLIYIQFEILS